jgi:hypothetical protein
MPFALVTVGLILVITGVKDTYLAMGQLVKGDFVGKGNFLYWIAALGIVGSVGYVERLRGFANAFMALIIIAMVLKNGGVFSQFKAALASGPVSPQAQAAPTQSASVPGSTDASASQASTQTAGGGSGAQYAGYAETAAMFLA